MLFRTLFPNLFTSGEATTTTYDEIRACGESTLDEWSFYNKNLSNSEIQNYAATGTPTWGINTLLLAHLDSNFDAGNFPEEDRGVTDWRILRRRHGTTDPFVQIGFIPNTNVNIFYDTKASANVSYDYAIQGVSNGTRGAAIFAEALSPDEEVLEAIKVSFWGWRLSSIDYDPITEIGTLYQFYVDLESDNISTTIGRTEYVSNYAFFPKIERGNLKYRTGRLTTRPFDEDENGAYTFGNNTSREELEEFLQNGEPKILKNSSGLTMVVDIFDVSIKYDDKLFNEDYSQPYMIEFSFVEIEDIANV